MLINKKHILSAKKEFITRLIKRQINVDTTLKQRQNNVETTSKQRRQRWNNVHPTFKSNLISTLIQRWKLMLNQRWFNVVVLAGSLSLYLDAFKHYINFDFDINTANDDAIDITKCVWSDFFWVHLHIYMQLHICD